MGLHILDHDEIDKGRWDALLASDPYAFPYQSSYFLDILSPGWKLITDENYSLGMALAKRRKYKLSYNACPDFTQQMGIISEKKLSIKREEEVLQLAAGSALYSEFNLNKNNTGPYSISKTHHFERKNYELSLEPSMEAIQENYHKNSIRNLKKANSFDLDMAALDSAQILIDTFIQNKAKELSKMELNFNLLLKLSELHKKNCRAELLQVLFEGKFLAGALLIHFNKRIVFLFSAQNQEGKDKRAMFYLIDQIISKYAGTDLLLDFEGSDNENLATFYRRFGAKESVYLQVRSNRLPWPIFRSKK